MEPIDQNVTGDPSPTMDHESRDFLFKAGKWARVCCALWAVVLCYAVFVLMMLWSSLSKRSMGVEVSYIIGKYILSIALVVLGFVMLYYLYSFSSMVSANRPFVPARLSKAMRNLKSFFKILLIFGCVLVMFIVFALYSVFQY